MIRVYACVLGVVILAAAQAWAADQKVTLVLGGKMCELYRPSVESALRKVQGVTAVDFKSAKGSVVVTAGPSVKPSQLEDAVNGVKGEGWYCTAKVKK